MKLIFKSGGFSASDLNDRVSTILIISDDLDL